MPAYIAIHSHWKVLNDLKAAAFVDGKQIGKVTHKQLYKNLISGKKYEITPEPKGMKGDILGENDILGADTVT